MIQAKPDVRPDLSKFAFLYNAIQHQSRPCLFFFLPKTLLPYLVVYDLLDKESFISWTFCLFQSGNLMSKVLSKGL